MGSRNNNGQCQFSVLDLNNGASTGNAPQRQATTPAPDAQPVTRLEQFSCPKENLVPVFVPNGCNIVLVRKKDVARMQQRKINDENGPVCDVPHVASPLRAANASDRGSRRRPRLNFSQQQWRRFQMTLLNLYEQDKRRDGSSSAATIASASNAALSSDNAQIPVTNILHMWRQEPSVVRQTYIARALQECQQRRPRIAAADADNARNGATRRMCTSMENNTTGRDKLEARTQLAYHPYAGHHARRAMATTNMNDFMSEMSEHAQQQQRPIATVSLEQSFAVRRRPHEVPLFGDGSLESISGACSSRAQHGGRGDGREDDGDHLDSEFGASPGEPSDSYKDIDDGYPNACCSDDMEQ